MRFVEIPLSGIVDYTSAEEFRNSPRIPITPHRAKSQSVNPRGDPDDVILIVAFNDSDRMVGYIGSLPDRLSLVPGKRVAWNSGWWIDPVLGKDAAMPLFYKFLEKWNKQVLFADLTPLTYKIACKTGFFQGRVRMGMRGYLRMPLSEILSPKNSLFRALKLFLGLTDFIFNLIWELRLHIWEKQHKVDQNIKCEFISNWDPLISDLIRHESAMELIRRGEAEFDWIRDYPWIIQGRPDENAIKYNFSSHSKRFEHHRIKISEGSQIKAFLIITLRDNHLRVPYLYYKWGSIPVVTEFLLHYMISAHASYISVFREDLSGYLETYKSPMIWKKRIARYSAISNELAGLLPEGYILQDGDGDAVFT